MRASQLFTKTSRVLPVDEPAKNAQLLIKAGFIDKQMAGVYYLFAAWQARVGQYRTDYS